MAGFKTGLLTGIIGGTLVGLFTAKKTGAQRQQGVADYVNGISDATKNVQQSVANLQDAAKNLMAQFQTELPKMVDGINKDVEDFSFQADGHMKAMNDIVTDTQEMVEAYAPNVAKMIAGSPEKGADDINDDVNAD